MISTAVAVDGASHVHLHHLDTGLAEVCCHGCGSSIIVRYSIDRVDAIQGDPVATAVKKSFVHRHLDCNGTDVDFSSICIGARALMWVLNANHPPDWLLRTVVINW